MMSPSDLLATLVLNAFQNSSGRIVLQSEKGRHPKEICKCVETLGAWIKDLKRGFEGLKGRARGEKRGGGLKGTLRRGFKSSLRGNLRSHQGEALRGASVKI